MKKNVLIFIGIFTSLAASRLIPHPPNFTSLLALSFYVPVFFGLRYLPVLLISFAITDLVIGYHSGTHWTWGSVFLIGLISPLFAKNIKLRISGAMLGACIFLVSLTLEFGLLECTDIHLRGLLNVTCWLYRFLGTAFYQLYYFLS
jgi:hypothetical protein